VISRVIVDCSHGNSQKLHTNQPKVAADIGAQASCALASDWGLGWSAAPVPALAGQPRGRARLTPDFVLGMKLAGGSTRVSGVMIESNLVAGNQKEPNLSGGKPLVYGQAPPNPDLFLLPPFPSCILRHGPIACSPSRMPASTGTRPLPSCRALPSRCVRVAR
jgi:hypothetical protein